MVLQFYIVTFTAVCYLVQLEMKKGGKNETKEKSMPLQTTVRQEDALMGLQAEHLGV